MYNFLSFFKSDEEIFRSVFKEEITTWSTEEYEEYLDEFKESKNHGAYRR